jgi:hypothetical protein
MLDRQIARCGAPPRQTAADGGYASRDNLKQAKARGVQDVAFHKKCGIAVANMVKSPWVYPRLRNFRAGIEAAISCFKRAYGGARCTWRGLDHFKAYVWSAVVAHNLVTLQENIAKFRTLEEDNFILRMDAREADIYDRRVLDLLKRARRELCAKYDVTLDRPVIVELFPRQQDFAIRTFGLPGGAGFLGVCFGTVITANSPASQGASPSCWEATLYHEFCHVVTLNKTNNKMPRWLSEGISVYEERQADPTWGQTMTPKYREMVLGEGFVPISKLSGAFLSPPSPLHRHRRGCRDWQGWRPLRYTRAPATLGSQVGPTCSTPGRSQVGFG